MRPGPPKYVETGKDDHGTAVDLAAGLARLTDLALYDTCSRFRDDMTSGREPRHLCDASRAQQHPQFIALRARAEVWLFGLPLGIQALVVAGERRTVRDLWLPQCLAQCELSVCVDSEAVAEVALDRAEFLSHLVKG